MMDKWIEKEYGAVSSSFIKSKTSRKCVQMMRIKKIGAIRSSNYLYLDPVISIIIGVIVLNERVGAVAVVG